MTTLSLYLEIIGAYFCGFMFYIVTPIVFLASLVCLWIQDR
jgi:hypothetical protein